MSRFNHPFIEDKFLTRPPGNVCFWCRRKVNVFPSGRNYFLVSWKPGNGSRILLGYCHMICPGIPPSEDSEKKVRPM